MVAGLDDLRDWTNNVQPHIPIYVAQRDFEVCMESHLYSYFVNSFPSYSYGFLITACPAIFNMIMKEKVPACY